jgi:hypothetical protein
MRVPQSIVRGSAKSRKINTYKMLKISSTAKNSKYPSNDGENVAIFFIAVKDA